MIKKDRVAVITGAAGGLGRVVTRCLAEQGARLVLLGRKHESLEQLAAELDLPEDRYFASALDLGDPGGVKAAADTAVAKFGRVDILLNFVGGWAGGQAVVDVPGDEVENMLRQHLWTTFYLAQEFVPHLLANQWGRIVVVSSPYAFQPRARGASYAIGKAAQETLMLTLANELKGTGVTANILLVRTIDFEHQRDNDLTPKNVYWTTPEEIASAVLYLCSDDARVVNGARIPLYSQP